MKFNCVWTEFDLISFIKSTTGWYSVTFYRSSLADMYTASMLYHFFVARRSQISRSRNARQTRYKTGFVTGAWCAGETSVSAVCYKMQLAPIVHFTFVSRCTSFLFMYISAWLAGLFSWVQCRNMLSLGADSMWIIHYVSFVKVQSHGTKYVCFGWASYPVDVAFSNAVRSSVCYKHTNTHLPLPHPPTFPIPTIGSSLMLTRPWLTANSSEPRLHQHSLKRNEACVCVNRVLTKESSYLKENRG
jgi:hypothetical protein